MIIVNSRNLIQHTQNALKAYETIRMGKGGKGIFSGVDDDHTHLIPTPIAAEEEEILEKYLASHKITGKNECSFIRETYLGCIRRSIFLEATLQKFLRSVNGGQYLRKEYYLFAVLCYLATWRLEEIGFTAFARFVQCFEPNKMASLVSFLFNPEIVEGELRTVWCSVLDEHFVRDKIIQHLLHHAPNAHQLELDLRRLATKGMEIQKSKVFTEPAPFQLTIPKERKVPEPTLIVRRSTRARSIPKDIFEIPKEQIALEKQRILNKEKSKKLYEKAQETQFKVSRPPTTDRRAKLCEQFAEQERIGQEKSKIRPQPPPPSTFVASNIHVKLTTAAILREEALLLKKRKEQGKLIEDAEMGLNDVVEFEAWKDRLKVKEEEERIIDLERKRLEVQLLHEETFLARKELIKTNKGKVAEVMAEKEDIKQHGEELRKETEIANLKKIEDVHQIKEIAIKAKEQILKGKAKNAAKIQQEKKEMQRQIHFQEQEERARKASLIQQIRLLELAAQSKPHIKDFDVTETSGFGLLGEMSVAELQERLVIAKSKASHEEEVKRRDITNLKIKKEIQISEKIQSIDQERQERRQKRISKSMPERGLSSMSMASDGSEYKDLLWEKEPKLKALQNRITLKRESRINSKKASIPHIPVVLAKLIDNEGLEEDELEKAFISVRVGV